MSAAQRFASHQRCLFLMCASREWLARLRMASPRGLAEVKKSASQSGNRDGRLGRAVLRVPRAFLR
eukprot:1108863-Pleurochrysis_carterae.AAC.2